ncbi:MAG: thiazole synthase, partial [Saccharospirillum sp.]
MLTIANTSFSSRLLTGTGKFSHPGLMLDTLANSGTELVTLALRRLDRRDRDAIFEPLQTAGYRLLPNTSGARTAEEAIQAAQLAREAMGTPWLKLEIHPDPRYLLPDPVETLKAAEQLVR